MGRAVDNWQATPVNAGTGWFQMHYAYNYLGNVTSHLNYKEGVTYTYTYDGAARLATSSKTGLAFSYLYESAGCQSGVVLHSTLRLETGTEGRC